MKRPSPAILRARADRLAAAVAEAIDCDMGSEAAYWRGVEAIEEAIDEIDEASRIREWEGFVSVEMLGLRASGDDLKDACRRWIELARGLARARAEARAA